VANHLRFSDLLEARVPGLEVYNFGLPSSGTDQQYLVWREFAQGIEHDAVVIAVYVENIRRVAAAYRLLQDEHGQERIYAKPYFTLDFGQLHLHHVPPRAEPLEEHELPAEERHMVDTSGRFLFLRKAVTALGAKELMQRLTRYQPVPAYDAPNTPDWQLMRAILSEWILATGKPVILMPIPLSQHMDGSSDAEPYRTRFRELAQYLGCTLHDLLPDLLKYGREERRGFRWEKDVHFTPRGNEVVADSLAPVIQDLLARHSREGTHG